MRYALAAVLILAVSVSGQTGTCIPASASCKQEGTAPSTASCAMWKDFTDHAYHFTGDCKFARDDQDLRIAALEQRVAELGRTVADLDKWAERSPCPKGSHFEADMIQSGFTITGKCHDDSTGERVKP